MQYFEHFYTNYSNVFKECAIIAREKKKDMIETELCFKNIS